jgi:hypothetical protein
MEAMSFLLIPDLREKICHPSESDLSSGAGEFWLPLEKNVTSFFKAHGVTLGEGIFRGPDSLLALLMLALLLSMALAIFSAVPWRAVVVTIAISAFLFGLAQIFEPILDTSKLRAVLQWSRWLIVALPPISMLLLGLSKVKTSLRDYLASISFFSGFFFFSIWWGLRASDFNSVLPSRDVVYKLPDGHIWVLSFAAVCVVFSWPIMVLLDRYRNLPED